MLLKKLKEIPEKVIQRRREKCGIPERVWKVNSLWNVKIGQLLTRTTKKNMSIAQSHKHHDVRRKNVVTKVPKRKKYVI